MMKKALNYLGQFNIESGQYVIAKINSNIVDGNYVDKRKLVYLPTGEVIEKSYYSRWNQEIPDYGKSLNMLEAEGLLGHQHETLCTDLSYQGVCDATLYTEDGIGFLGQNEAIATTSQYGDGIFSVYVFEDETGCIINTGDTSFISELDLSVIYFKSLDNPFELNETDGGVAISDPCPSCDKLRVVLPAGTYHVSYGWPTEQAAQEERHHYVMLLRDGEGVPMPINPNMLLDVAPEFDSTMGYLLTSAWNVYQQNLELYRASKVKDAGGEVNLMAQLTHSCSRVSGWINEVIDFEELNYVFDYEYAAQHKAGSLAEVIYLEALKQSSDFDVCQAFLAWCNNNQIRLKPAVDLMI